MPQVNILIGIGGTGSKIVESALVLLAAGVGGEGIEGVVVGAVEQDGQNGNCGRMQRLLTTINSLQELRGDENPNRLVANPNAEGFSPLLSIRMEPLFPAAEGDEVRADWCPEEEPGQSIISILGVANKDLDRQALFDLLYRTGEQTMTLEGGYVGCAHVGAAAMRAAIETSEFNKRLKEILDAAGLNQEVRIFLAGSAFGGTGASGFPTIARHINKLRRQNSKGEPIPKDEVRCRTGGVLMLPYFRFNDPEDPEATAVRSSEILRNSRVALEYYARLAEEDVFDRLYLTGWDSLFHLNYHESSGSEQKNPPLPPEIYAALATIDYFTAEDVTGGTYLCAARNEPGRFGWSDLPRGEEARERVGRLLRTASYWRLSVHEALQQPDSAGAAAWRRALAADSSEWGTVPAHLDEFFEKLLGWATSMRLFADTGSPLAFEAWNTSELIQSGSSEQPQQDVELRRSASAETLAAIYQMLVPPQHRGSRSRSAADLYEDINNWRRRRPTGDNRGLGRLVAELHHAARAKNRTEEAR